MSYTLDKIAQLTGCVSHGRLDRSVDWLLTDSRSLGLAPESLFFAIRTERQDGSDYVGELYQRGVRAFVVEADYPENKMPEDATFLLAHGVLKALQKLAACHRERFRIPVVGITGSNGKTVVKEWLNHLLAPSRHLVRSPRSYNSQIGVPLSVWQMGPEDEIGIFEAGISRPGEMAALEPIIRPRLGLLTNIGGAHQENFTSLKQKCLEKLDLFVRSEALIYNADDRLVEICVKEKGLEGIAIPYSMKDSSRDLYIRSVSPLKDGSRVEYVFRGQAGAFTVPFTTRALVEDAVSCLAVCLVLGLDASVLEERMPTLPVLSMRLEVIEGNGECQIVNDSYSLDMASLDTALDFMGRRSAQRPIRRTLVLSDFLQSGLQPRALYQEVSRLLRGRDVSRLVGVGPDISSNSELFDVEEKSFYPTTDALMAAAGSGELKFHGEMVLVKGARSFGLDRLSDFLSHRVHETTLEVSLSALAQNLDYYRSFLGPDTRMVCMVKASAYGHGALEVARTLQDKGVEYLAVAVADEGRELRAGGIRTHILVMNPELSAFKTLFDYHLEPEVYSFRLLEALIGAARREGLTGFPVHVKVDTGMHRLGFLPQEMPELIRRLKNQDAVLPVSVFSHFVGSDSGEFDAFTKEQIAIFTRASECLESAFQHRILRHICNSAGIERFSGTQFDMVRLGLGLYGVDPVDYRMLHNVSTLRTTILQIHQVPREQTVGYSRRGRLTRDSRIAAIPIGYADGLNRHLGCGKGYCLVKGKKAPYVGNICMDVSMIDVTDIDCREGDSVEIFGADLPVTVLSDLLETIPYEVLTSVSMRVKRVYFQD